MTDLPHLLVSPGSFLPLPFSPGSCLGFGRFLSNFIINCPKVVQLPFSPALRTFPPIHYTCSLAHYMGNNPSWGVSQNLYTQLVLLLFGGIILVRVLARDHLATIYFVDSV